MNKDRLLSLIKDHGQTDKQDTKTLSDLINTYPFFQTAHLLLLQNLNEHKDDQFDQQLRESAIFVSNRQVLFNLLYYKSKPSDADSASPSELLEIDETNPITNIDIEKPKVAEFDIPPVSPDENYTIPTPGFELDETGVTKEETAVLQSPPLDLIGKFIEDNPAFTPNRLDLNESHEDISLNSIQENEELATETLATIYISQKLYDKAISIYEKLILKFPEKSTYFAEQINKLKNTIK